MNEQTYLDLLATIAKELTASGARVSTAESCTGGAVAAALTSRSGASNYFSGGIVAYANDIKQSLLDVSSSDLLKYGAVSRQVAEQMAQGAANHLQTEYALATTGVAGPTGGTKDKPVGTVWIAIAYPGGTTSECLNLTGNRDDIVRQTVYTTLERFAQTLKTQPLLADKTLPRDQSITIASNQ